MGKGHNHTSQRLGTPSVRRWVWLFLLSCSCASSLSSQPPETLLRKYEAAVLRHDAAAVYALLGSAQRQQMTEAEFARFFAENYLEIREEARALVQQAAQGQEEQRILLQTGETAILLRDAGAWKLSAVELLAVSPRAWAAAFATKLEASAKSREGSWLLSAEAAAEQRARQADLARLLRQVTESDIREEGDVAFVLLLDGRQLQLVLTARGWLLARLPEELTP